VPLITPLIGYARIRHLLPTLLHPPRSVDLSKLNPQPPAAAPAHRLRAATWINGRTALGAGLVLLAVLAGALFLDRSQRLVPVYAAARDLPAGTSPGGRRSRGHPGPPAGHGAAALPAAQHRPTGVRAGPDGTGPARDAHPGRARPRLQPAWRPGGAAGPGRPGRHGSGRAARRQRPGAGRLHRGRPPRSSGRPSAVRRGRPGLPGPGRAHRRGQDRGVQLRMPSDRAPIVAAAIATAWIFVVKTRGSASDDGAAAPRAPGGAGARCPGPTPRSRTPSRRAPQGRTPRARTPRGRTPRGRTPRSPIPRRRVQVPPTPAGPFPAAASRPRPPPPTPATPR
jgi:hypothetical protein